jgi:DNA-binding NarL/FixJ family response regulator
MVREGLRSMLTAPDVEVVGEAATGAEALGLAATLAPDVILLDLELPDAAGTSVLARLRRDAPRAAVLVVTMHGAAARVRDAIEAGAAGYLLKGIGRRELLAAVRAVRDGDSVVDPALLRAVVAAARRPAAPLAITGDGLTPVEADVLRCIAEGATNREIATRMRWSLGTAKKYVQRVLEKLEASDRTQAAVEAMRRGLLP